MAFRRFQNFQIGALTSARLNEMQDAISRLQARVDRAVAAPEAVKDRILARITGQGTKGGNAQSCGAGSIRTVSYPFQEVFLRIGQVGSITATTCVDTESADGGIGTSSGAHLVRFEDEPTLSSGTIVIAQLASFAASNNASDKQQVYVALGGVAGGSMRLARVTQVLGPGVGLYKARFLGPGEQQEVEFRNIYEIEDYYGATDANIECALISPRRIEIGRVVWLQQVMGESTPNAQYPDNSWVTLVPVAFDAECTCGPGGLAGQQLVSQGMIPRDADGAIGNIMLDKGLTLT